MNYQKITANKNFICIYNAEGFKIFHAQKSFTVEIKNIHLIEMDQFNLNKIYIVTKEHLIVGKVKHTYTVSYKFPLPNFIETITDAALTKFLYYKRSKSIFYYLCVDHIMIVLLVLNDTLLWYDESSLYFLKGETPIKEAFMPLPQNTTNTEVVYFIDQKNNFFSFDTGTMKIISKVEKVNEIFSHVLCLEDHNYDLNFLVIDEGFLFLMDSRTSQSESVKLLVKNENAIKCPIDNEGKPSYEIINFMECDIGIRLAEKYSCSLCFKKYSALIHMVGNIVYVLIYWNMRKVFQVCQIITKGECLSIFPEYKKKKLKLNVLLNNSILSIYKIEFSKGKNIVRTISDPNKEINLNSNTSIKIRNVEKNNNITITSNSNNKLLSLFPCESPLSFFSDESFNALKNEVTQMILTQNDSFKNIGSRFEALLEDKLNKILIKHEKRILYAVGNYVKSVEKTLYEERLLSQKLSLLADFVSKTCNSSGV